MKAFIANMKLASVPLMWQSLYIREFLNLLTERINLIMMYYLINIAKESKTTL